MALQQGQSPIQSGVAPDLPVGVATALLWLKYYADDVERRDFAREMPDEKIPDHEDPPFDRDRHLPVPRPF